MSVEMESLRELIVRNLDTQVDFEYYLTNIDLALQHQFDNPDTAYDCCYALLQGIAKTIVYRIDPTYPKHSFENESLNKQIKIASSLISEDGNLYDVNFASACENLYANIGRLRRARGEISHGRAAPKELESDMSLSRLAVDITGAILRYMLSTYFAICEQKPVEISYEDNAEFNDHLDEFNPLEGKLLYSKALYEQDYQDYLYQLDLYQADQEEPA